jgi:hypothetical protein
MTEENQTKTEKPRKLTKKERGFVNSYVETENGTQSALKHYDVANAKVAGVIAVENLAKPRIQEAIEVKRKSLKEALIAKGITEDYLADKVGVLLTATNEKGQEDYTAIDKGLKHATNIYGVVDPQKQEGGNTYNFLFSPETQADIKLLEDKIKARLLNKNV